MENTTRKLEMELPSTLTLAIGWGATRLVFCLRMITIEEERLYYKSFADISDSASPEEKEYAILVDSVAKWSEKVPEIYNVQGPKDRQPFNPSITVPADAVRELFAERTVLNERLINSLMSAYRDKLTPDISFL